MILSSALDGGKHRSLAIIAGLTISFIAFSLLLGSFFSAIGAEPVQLRAFATIAIAFFAVTMIFSGLGDQFSRFFQPIASLGQRLQGAFRLTAGSKENSGLVSGLFLGACLGLIWTPCVGPLIGSALVQASAQDNLLGNLQIIGSFSLGVALPMLALSFFGKGLIDNLQFIKERSGLLRKAFGVIILGSLVLNGSGLSNLKALFAPNSSIPAYTAGGSCPISTL